jgi:integrase
MAEVMNQGQEDAAMRAKLRYLQQRGGYYRYVRSIPFELRSVAGKQQWVKVLGTSDLAAAIAMRPRCDAAFDVEMMHLRIQSERAPQRATEADVQTLATQDFIRLQAMQEQMRRSGPPKTPAERDGMADALAYMEAIHSEQLALGDVSYFEGHARQLLQDNGLIADERSPEFALLVELLIRADKEVLSLHRARLRGDFGAVSSDPAFAEASAGKVKLSKRRSVSDLIDAYVEDRRGGWGKATEKNYLPAWRLLKDALGANRDVATVSREDARRVLSLLRLLPAQIGKNPKLKGLGPVKAAERNATLGLPVISTKTVNNFYLAPIRGAFGWAQAEGWLAANPFTRLSVAEREVGQTLRDQFTVAQLAQLFEGSPWQPRDEGRSGRFWLPLLALFTGARLGEIAGLRVADIVTSADGVPMLDIKHHEGRELKTASSIRRVPVHSELVRIGFLRFVQQRKDEGASTLFADVRTNAHGKVGAKIGEWFGALLREREITGIKLGMHSFRHTFESRMSEIGLGGTDAVLYLTGRKPRGSRGAYLHAPSADVLQQAIERLTYPGLDLSHLHAPQ